MFAMATSRVFFKNVFVLFRTENKSFCKRNLSSNTIGFIGLGNMGSRMATNLVKRGHTVKVYDVVPSTAKSVQDAKICGSPQEAAADSSVVITMLPNSDTVLEAVLGDKGILKGIPKNSLFVDCSTIEPKVAQQLHKTANDNNIRFVDAPVSGGITGAEAGTLTFMVGGKDEDVKVIQPLLLNMGSKVLHCGGAGAGQIAKLCNNLILAASMCATAEAMNLGIKLGLDPKVLTSVVNISSGRCWSSDTYNPVPGVMEKVPSSNGYKGGFSCKLIVKDLGLIENASSVCEAPIPFAAAAHQLYRAMLANGYAQKDFSSVYEFFKGNN